MILNLLRVEQLKVEDMMKRSFAEFSHQKNAPEYDEKRIALKKQITQQPELDCPICTKDLKHYYQQWKEYHVLTRQLQVFAIRDSLQGHD